MILNPCMLPYIKSERGGGRTGYWIPGRDGVGADAGGEFFRRRRHRRHPGGGGPLDFREIIFSSGLSAKIGDFAGVCRMSVKH